MHRDVKPGNVLLSSRGEAKLSDFGIAKNVSEDASAQTMVGTFRYMSPERLRGEDYSYESDCWSMGMVLLEAARGRPVFPPNCTPLDLHGAFQMAADVFVARQLGNTPASPDLVQFAEACLQRTRGGRAGIFFRVSALPSCAWGRGVAATEALLLNALGPRRRPEAPRSNPLGLRQSRRYAIDTLGLATSPRRLWRRLPPNLVPRNYPRGTPRRGRDSPPTRKTSPNDGRAVRPAAFPTARARRPDDRALPADLLAGPWLRAPALWGGRAPDLEAARSVLAPFLAEQRRDADALRAAAAPPPPPLTRQNTSSPLCRTLDASSDDDDDEPLETTFESEDDDGDERTSGGT